MPPNSQPLAIQPKVPEADLKPGTSQVVLITSVRPTLKSEPARLSFGSNQFHQLEIEVANWSPATEAEFESMFLPQVKEPCTWKPRLIFFWSPTCSAS